MRTPIQRARVISELEDLGPTAKISQLRCTVKLKVRRGDLNRLES